MENNIVKISGMIQSPFEYSHKVCGESFYSFALATQRTSGVYDYIPVTVSERLIDTAQDMTGKRVTVEGQFRSYNMRNETGGTHLKLYVFARNISEGEQEKDKNIIYLDGNICKETKYRITPKGREVADILLAINRLYRKSDYIPCICWGRNARFADGLEVGTRISVQGRIQSREYTKKLDDETEVKRIAYEVSIGMIEEVENEEEGEADEC